MRSNCPWILACCIWTLATVAASAVDYKETYQASNTFRIDWCRDANDIRFRLAATARGWVAIGFNDAQMMPGSDVVMLTGEGNMQDAFANVHGAPLKDEVQNATLNSFKQENGVTTVEFSRPIKTGDSPDDRDIDADLYMVWAVNSSNDSFFSRHSGRGFTNKKINFGAAGACGGLALPNDLNQDGKLDVADVDLLRESVRGGTNPAAFDVNGDQFVNTADIADYLRVAFKSYIGDANLDGQFSTSDLSSVFTFGQYEDGVAQNSGWSQGDWNADAEFSAGDLVFAFQDGGFEAGPRTAALAVVPEPASAAMMVGMMLAGLPLVRRTPALRSARRR